MKKASLLVVIFFVVVGVLLIWRSGGRKPIVARVPGGPSATQAPSPILPSVTPPSKSPMQEGRKYAPGDYQEIIIVDDHERSYVLHIPTGFDDRKKYPLLFVFHGAGGTAQSMVKKTGFNAYADRDGFVVVYPDGVEKSWNDGRGTTYADQRGVNDVRFISALIDRVASVVPIDENRIYATGMSNGAIFSHRLACELSSKFAAIGPVAGEIPEALAPSCQLSGPMSRVAIHGVEDPFNRFSGGATRGGAGGRIVSAHATAEKWAAHNGCSLTPTRTQLPITVKDGTSVEQWVYPNCKNGTDVVLYAVNGMGHAWPPQAGEVPRISGNTSQNIDATKVIWEFFKTHPPGQ